MTATITHTLGKFVWHELYSPDVEASKRFYADVFGWRWQDAPMGDFTYRLAYLGDHQIGGMVDIPGVGSMALAQDPHGAKFCTFQFGQG